MTGTSQTPAQKMYSDRTPSPQSRRGLCSDDSGPRDGRSLDASSAPQLLEAGYTDIRPTHGCVFRFVHGDGMRLTELASLAGLTKQSVGEIVDDLVGLGYIERFPDPTDKRAKLIRLTAKGEDAQRHRLRPLRRARRATGPSASAPTASPPSAPSSKRSPWPKRPPPSPSSSSPEPAPSA